MLSNTCKYAIRAMTYIALHAKDKGNVGLRQISDNLRIPSPFLGKVLQLLTKHKLLKSIKGPNGGFSLARNADEINLLDIIELIDGIDTFGECLFGYNFCGNDSEKQKICPIHPKINTLVGNIKEVYGGQTIKDIAERFANSKTKIYF